MKYPQTKTEAIQSKILEKEIKENGAKSLKFKLLIKTTKDEFHTCLKQISPYLPYNCGFDENETPLIHRKNLHNFNPSSQHAPDYQK